MTTESLQSHHGVSTPEYRRGRGEIVSLLVHTHMLVLSLIVERQVDVAWLRGEWDWLEKDGIRQLLML